MFSLINLIFNVSNVLIKTEVIKLISREPIYIFFSSSLTYK